MQYTVEGKRGKHVINEEIMTINHHEAIVRFLRMHPEYEVTLVMEWAGEELARQWRLIGHCSCCGSPILY